MCVMGRRHVQANILEVTRSPLAAAVYAPAGGGDCHARPFPCRQGTHRPGENLPHRSRTGRLSVEGRELRLVARPGRSSGRLRRDTLH